MKKLLGKTAMGLVSSFLLTTTLVSTPANAIDYDITTIEQYLHSWDHWSSGEKLCILNFNIVISGQVTDEVLWSYYPVDYTTVKLEDSDGNVLSDYDTFASPGETYYIYSQGGGSLISVRLVAGQHVGPFTLKFYDSTTNAYDPEVLVAEYDIDQQSLIDKGGNCAVVATGETNNLPVANAGPDIFKALPNHVIYLDGTASSDEDGDSLTYAWRQIEGPVVILDDATSPTPTFTYPPVYAHEKLVFELVVSDGSEESEPSTVTIVHNGRSNGNNAR